MSVVAKISLYFRVLKMGLLLYIQAYRIKKTTALYLTVAFYCIHRRSQTQPQDGVTLDSDYSIHDYSMFVNGFLCFLI